MRNKRVIGLAAVVVGLIGDLSAERLLGPSRPGRADGALHGGPKSGVST